MAFTKESIGIGRMQAVRRVLALFAGISLIHGCATPGPVPSLDLPRELSKIGQPEYVIEPPDILQIDLISAIPKSATRIRTLDVLLVNVPDALPDSPVSGTYGVEPTGQINLGPQYGTVLVAGLSMEEARSAIQKQLSKALKKSTVNLSLLQTRAVQQIRGPHLVRGDGSVGLGAYGSVPVVGLTLAQAKQEIEHHLQESFQDPEISLDVVGYNSKTYYVVFDYGSAGQQIVKLPLTGNETVLDGISQTQGLPTVADARKIWVTRPRPDNCPPQVLPVDWKAVTELGDTRTNYQLLPGDRIFVKAYSLVEVDVKLARFLSPFERIFGVTLLGSSTVNTIRTDPNRLNGIR